MEHVEEVEARKSVSDVSSGEGQRIVNGFVIDTLIPVQQARPFQRKHPLPLLNVGDSFFLPKIQANNFHNTVRYWSEKLNCRFCMRTVTENGVKGIRVWRVE
jgi:hypothetical protein